MALRTFEEWLGRERVVEGRIDPEHARKLAATLDLEVDDVREGEPLPLGWHWAFLTEAEPRSALGPDGHARRGDFIPPIPRERRMWAGGSLRFLSQIRIGSVARRRSTIRSIEHKQGRAGPLSFVTVRHRISDSGGVVIEEDQDLVYLDRARGEVRAPGAAAERSARPGRELVDRFEPDEVTLFRFSALTFNGHRIHYDRAYARDVEGYPDLVVHGPLVALLLLSAGLRAGGVDRGRVAPSTPLLFQYRARRPAFLGEALELFAEPSDRPGALELEAAVAARGAVMTATLSQER
jgi:3-methylfumaryl-CoA hydratase